MGQTDTDQLSIMPYENYNTHGVYEDIRERDQFFEGMSKVSQRRCELNLKVRAGFCHVDGGERKSNLSRVMKVYGVWGNYLSC